MTTSFQRWVRYRRYRKAHGHLVWLVGRRAERPRTIAMVRPALAVKGRHLHRPRFISDDSLLASMSSPA